MTKNSVAIEEGLTVRELAARLAIRPVDLISRLMNVGRPHSINQRLEISLQRELVEHFGHVVLE